MKFAWTGVLGVVLSLAAATVAEGQERCRQVLPSDSRRVVTEGGQEIFYFRNPVRMLCTGGVQIEADSAVMNRTTSSLEMVGRVLYRDGDRQLTSDWAHYLGQTEELYARGSVVLTDLADGSVITGEDFEYRRETEARPEAHMIMLGGRPHAVLPPSREPEPGVEPTPVLVWAERMEMFGEREFVARTDVEIERGDLRGAADEARFDQVEERIILTGQAHVETEQYRLEGQRIDAHVLGDTLRDVLSERDARLLAEELTVFGHTIRIGFSDGQPERVEAWNPTARPAPAPDADPEAAPDTAARRPAAPPTPLPPRAVAISADFQLRADSIDARSEGGRLREVRAVGRAYGEREADSLSVGLPDAVARDWIQGDTINGYFVDAGVDDEGAQDPDSLAEATPDTEAVAAEPAREAVLDRIEVIGGDSHALSLYRTEDPEGGTSPAVNFMRATRITLFMVAGEVDRVEADGPIEGLYLDPVRAASPPAPDTAAAEGRPGR